MLLKRIPMLAIMTVAFALVVSACGSPTPTKAPATTAPTAAPAEKTAEPTKEATKEITAEATKAATTEATKEATKEVTAEPTKEATKVPTTEPTKAATAEATKAATVEATKEATKAATAEATKEVAMAATAEKTVEATKAATVEATKAATAEATKEATKEVTAEATVAATAAVTATAAATEAATPRACKAEGELLVATDAAYPPFESVNTTTNKIEGFDVDLLDAIGKVAGFTPTYQNAPFDTIFTNLAAGQSDLVISASTITEERLKTVSFSDPYFVAGQVIVVREADKDKVAKPEDLVGKKIGVQLGTTGAEAAKGIKDAKVSEYPTFPEAATALVNGDVDAVVNDNATSLTYILNTPDTKLVVVGDSFTTENYGIAVRQDCTALTEKINKGLKEVIASGEYAKIFRKYFGADPIKEFTAGNEGINVNATPAATEAATATPAATVEATKEVAPAATTEATPAK